MIENRSSVAVIDLGVHLLADQTAFRQIGKYSLLEWTIRRLAESSLLDAIAVTGSPVQHSALKKLAIEPAQWRPSEALTPLQRTIEVAIAANAKWIVLIQADSPCIDPILVDRLIAAAWATPTSDLISFASTSRDRNSSQNAGWIAEICSRRALRRLADMDSLSCDVRPVGRLLLSMPEFFQTRYLALPKALDRDQVDWVLKTEDDWEISHMPLDSKSAHLERSSLAALAMHNNRN